MFSMSTTYTVPLSYSFHSKVKRHPSYLANIANRRIDHLINVLLKIEESEFLDSQKKEHWNSANRWTQKEESRHHRAVMISDTDVEVRTQHIANYLEVTNYNVTKGLWR